MFVEPTRCFPQGKDAEECIKVFGSAEANTLRGSQCTNANREKNLTPYREWRFLLRPTSQAFSRLLSSRQTDMISRKSRRAGVSPLTNAILQNCCRRFSPTTAV